MIDDDFDPDEPVEIPIDGVLDLHLFRPRDIKTLVPDYLEECHKRGITAVRIIHGKGTGALRKSVHALLDRNPLVLDYRLAGQDAGGWGATQVDLKEAANRPDE
jgi:DNA-nicking Smr family endonuclease